MWKVIVIAAMLSPGAAASTRPEVSWLIEQGGAKPVLAQVWPIRPPPKPGLFGVFFPLVG